MTSLTNMTNAVDYIEDNLKEDIDFDVVAKIALCSRYHFLKMFTFIVGIPPSEYIRKRRLTLAAFDLQNTNDKVINIALRYGYQSPDSFTKAFQKIHQVTPTQARENGALIKAYPRVNFSISIEGNEAINYKIVEKNSFKVIGFKRRLSIENLMNGVGEMWDSMTPEKIQELTKLSSDNSTSFPMGIYSEMYDDNSTDYYIAVPSSNDKNTNLESLVIPSSTWAVFECRGALPLAMGEMFQRIYKEWFPTSNYEHSSLPELEWYSDGDMSSDSYKSEIWIPINSTKL